MSEFDDFLKLIAEAKEQDPKYQQIKQVKQHVKSDLGSLFEQLGTAVAQDPKKKLIDSVKQNVKSDLNSLFEQLSSVANEPVIEESAEQKIDELVQEVQLIEAIEATLEEVIEEPKTPKESQDAVEKYIQSLPKDSHSFQQPEVDTTKRDLKAVTDKLKFLEQWVAKISAAGPGGGEVNLRWLDDVDRSTIADGKYLNYNATTKKFQFSTLSGGGAPQVQSDWTQLDNTDPSFIKNKPAIPDAQVNSDWNASTGVAQILNKPTLFSGNYNDLTNKPTIPTNLDSLTDVTITNPTISQVLKYNGSQWVNDTDATSSGGSTTPGYYGSFYDLQTQSAAAVNTPYPVYLRTMDGHNGVSVASNSRVTCAYAGVYNIQFSLQMYNQGGGGNGTSIWIWIRQNGVDVVDTATNVEVITNSPYVVPAWNFIVSANAGDYFELMWATNNTHIVIQYESPKSFCPAIPSAILTVQEVAAVLIPTDITGNANTVTHGVYTTDTGTVTNTMLAGSISNAKLTNSSVTVNGSTVSLGATTTINTLVNGSFTASLTSVGQLQLPIITQGGFTGGTLVATGDVLLNANGNVWKFGSDGTMNSPYNVKILTTGVQFPDSTTQTTAWTGTYSYNNLTDKPTIPTNVSAFTNDASYVTSTGLNTILGSFVNNASLATTLGSYASTSYVDTRFTNLIGAAPAALDTLKEIADQLSADESIVSSLTTSVAGKVSLTGSYANPDWITSLAYSKLTGAPTALSAFTNDSGFITSTGSISGNASTATKLATARAINGVNFDGSAAISIGSITNNGYSVSVSTSGQLQLYNTLSLPGSTSGSVTLKATAVAGSPIISLPPTTGTLITTGDNGTVSNTMLATAYLTVNGTTIALGGSNTVTADASTLTNTTLNATVTSSSLTSVGTLTNLTVAGGASPSAGVESTHYLNVGARGHMFDDGNFHLHAKVGDVWLNSLESGRYIQLNTQGYGAGVKMGGDVISTTPFQGKSPFNSALNTEVVVDNLKYRIANSGGVFPQIESNTSGTVDICWSILGVVSGAGTTSNENSGTLVANNAWTTLYSTHGMDTRGDNLVAHITDKNAGRIYRATFMVTNNSSNTTGYNIVVERII